MSPKKARRSFSLRLQPYEGTLLAEVVDYLNSLERDEVSKEIADVLIMCFLPLARQTQGEKFSSEELRLCCLEACDALSKHASFLRQALQVAQPQFESPRVGSSQQRDVQHLPNSSQVHEELASPQKSAESSSSNLPSPLIQGKGSSDDVDALFGDF